VASSTRSTGQTLFLFMVVFVLGLFSFGMLGGVGRVELGIVLVLSVVLTVLLSSGRLHRHRST
jgi:hypothetical protein